MENVEFTLKEQPKIDQEYTRKRFEGKIAVVTGGGSGIGYAVAERFANDGARVVILDIDDKNIKLAEKRFKDANWSNITRKCDVTDKSQLEFVISEVCKLLGKNIDFLVTSAAYFGSKGIESRLEDWKKTLDVNIVGVSNIVQTCIPYMKNSNQASIVTISSISAVRAQPDRWTYSASKGAILTLTKNMALDLSKYNIRVNSVSPGWIWSPEQLKASSDKNRETMDKDIVQKFTLLGRSGYTSEVAGTVTFLCSRDAAYITGTNIMVDGGYSCIGPERKGENSVFAGSDMKP